MPATHLHKDHSTKLLHWSLVNPCQEIFNKLEAWTEGHLVVIFVTLWLLTKWKIKMNGSLIYSWIIFQSKKDLAVKTPSFTCHWLPRKPSKWQGRDFSLLFIEVSGSKKKATWSDVTRQAKQRGWKWRKQNYNFC